MMKNLKELSLKIVMDHVDRFNVACQHSNDPLLQMSMVFLQREFSFHLISELTKRDGFLDEKYFLFLLNEYTRVLDLMVWEHCNLNHLYERFVVMGKCLVEVQIQFRNSPRPSMLRGPLGPNYQDANLQQFINSIIPQIRKVKILKIPHLCNNDTLKRIGSHCHDLMELDINESEDISFAGFRSLFKRTKAGMEIKVPIKKLNMESTIVDDKVIYHLLKYLTCLEVFIYPDVGELLYLLYRKDVFDNTLSSPRNLIFLDLTQYFESSLLTGILMVCTNVCPFISKLSIPALNEEQARLLSNFPALKSLHLKGEPTVTSGLDVSNHLTPIKNKLLELKVDYFTISLISLIQNCPNLQVLYLYNVNFVNADYSKCDLSLFNLYDLTLHSMFVTNINFLNAAAIIKLLNSIPNLRKLTVNFSQEMLNVHEDFLMSFLHRSQIEQLEFNYNSFEISVLERMIQNCSYLKTIVFRMSFMKKEKIRRLSVSPCVLRNNITIRY